MLQSGMRAGVLVAAAFALLALPGCRYTPGIVPPFDGSGLFRGAWSGTINGVASPGCVLRLDITHDTNGFLPGSSVMEADLTLNLTCPGVSRMLEDSGLPAIQVVPVRGYVSGSGQVYLGAVQTTLSYQLAVGIDARGFDDDKDGRLDRLEGPLNIVLRPRNGAAVTVEAAMVAEADRG